MSINLFRSATTVGGLTMVSRVLGFLRDMLIAASLGTGPVADAFVVAFRFPNLFRRLFGEGAFNAAFVPLFTKQLETNGKSAAREFGEQALSVLFAALIVFTIVAEIAMPWLMYIIAPGFLADPAKFELTIILTQIAFPYLAFMSLVALFSGVLNALGRFAAAAAAPIALNIVLIAVLFLVLGLGYNGTPQAGYLLVWGVSFAGLVQLTMLIYAGARAGMVLKPRRPRLTAPVKRLIVLGVPGLIAGGITQINIVIGTMIASLQESAVSYLYYADRIYQLPLGVVGVAIGIVLLPDLTARLAKKEFDSANHSQNRALEISMMLTLPAAVALMVMPQPILQTLFERGAFTPSDTQATSTALAAFAIGLPAFVLIKVFSPGFFAREDTKTPMLFAAVSVFVNVAGSLALYFYIGHVGIALATSIAGWVNALLLWTTLKRRGQFAVDDRLRARLPGIVGAALIMGLVLFGALYGLGPVFQATALLTLRLAVLLGLVVLGVATFFAAAGLFGAVGFGEIKSYIRRR